MKLTAEQIETVETLAGLGMTEDQIAVVLKISKMTFRRMVKRDAALRDHLEQGRVKTSTMLRQSAYQLALKDKDSRMIIFLLKTKEGFRETDRLEITGKDGEPIRMNTTVRKERLAKLKSFMNDTEEEAE